jgi:predicted nucleic acid-binding protein
VKERTFFDTNVLVYADDLDAGPKTKVARRLIREALTEGKGVLSTQVLQEFFVVSTRKLKVPVEVAREKVELFSAFEVMRIEPRTVVEAIDLHQQRSISFWDALVVRTAALAGATRLLTEDLQHGQTLDGVRIENPFL